ncbi:MAG: two-component regulator propeller domain-containing protein [Niabella sp.]
MMKSVLIILVACLSCIHAGAQPFYFRHYEVEDGLSNNTVITALQDKYGFIWLGTSEGLNRFDGSDFKVYRYSPNKPHGLKSNSIFCLYEDGKGLLWAGTERGFFRYDPAIDDFRQPLPLENGTVRSICDDDDGRLWFILSNELYYYDTQRNIAVKKYIPGITNVSVLYKDVKKGIWIGTTDGKVVYLHNNQANIYKITNRPRSSIEAIHACKNNRLLIGSSKDGLQEFDLSKKRIRQLIKEEKEYATVFVRNILQVSDSSFFVSTENGLYIYNPVNNQYQHLLKSSINPFSLSDNALYALCKDSEGGIWIGSYFGGVNYLPYAPLSFEKYFPTTSPHSLSGNAVREITKDRYGHLWIGSEDGGLTLFDPRKNIFEKYKPDGRNRLSSSNIHGLLAVGNKLLIGTFERGLDIMDLSARRVVKHFNAGTGAFDLKSNFINKILQTSGGDILLCTANGVFSFDINKERFYPQPALPEAVFYSAIAEDSNGTVWLGTHNQGLFYLNKNDTGAFRLTADRKHILRNTRILYLMPDTNNHLWVCTIDGLFDINLADTSFKYYSTEQGLPSNMVYTIIKDNLNNYWITTSKGLVHLDTHTQQIRVFRKNNGLLNNQFNYQSAYKNEEGDIYLGSIKGLIKFNPAFFHIARFVPPLYITALQQTGIHLESQSGFNNDIPLLLKKELQLKHNQATFNIAFAALQFTDPLNILYAYKINGSGWYAIGNTRKIAFVDLAPGKYNITIRSTNSAGLWMPNEKNITIEIWPPFWKSPVAYLLYTLFTIAIILLSFGYYVTRQKEKQRYRMHIFSLNKEKELYQAKIDFFTNITHEIKTPLTLIKLPLERITAAISNNRQLQQYLQIMNSNTQRLLNLTHQLLDFRKVETENYTLYLSDIDVVEMTKKIARSFQPALTEKNISLKFASSEKKIIIAADKEALTKIISNLIDNAIKYCDRHIDILFEHAAGSGMVILQIKNDGPVIPENLRDKVFDPFFRHHDEKISGSGIGLPLAHSLILLHKGTLIYTVRHHKNIFSVSFPVKFKNTDN